MDDADPSDWHPAIDALLEPDERVRAHLEACADCRLEHERLVEAEALSAWTWAHLADDQLMRDEVGLEGADHLRQCAFCRNRRAGLLDAERTLGTSGAKAGLGAATAPTGAQRGDDHWRLLLDLLRQAGFSLHQMRIVDPDRPMCLAKKGGSTHLLAAFTPEEGALVAARFAQVEGELHDVILPWRDLRKLSGGWLAIGDPPPARGVLEALELHPLAAVRFFGQAAVAVAALHDRGLAHGGLVGSALGVTDTGRLRLAPPALHLLGAPADDRRHLGELLQDLCIDGDVHFAALLDLAIALQQGQFQNDGALMARVLELWELVRAGAGRYALQAPLGVRSAFGEVWRARDAVVRRDVALKFLQSDARMGEDAFVAEARITARLQHPNIVPIYDIGESFDGRPYYTMEEVRGSDMAAAIRDLHGRGGAGGVDVSRRHLIDVFARIAETMAFAHDRGVAHCDLKPENVMLGTYGEVRVVDWGMAADIGTLWRGGTPYYIAPEYHASVRSTVQPQGDVYALGKMLEDVLFGLRGGAPPPEAPPLPGELVDLARDCTRAAPEHRPPDGGAVAIRVRAWLDGLFQRDKAEQALQSVAGKAAEADTLRAEALRKRREAASLLDGVKPWDPIERKLPAWTVEDAAKLDERRAAVADTRYEQGVRAALEMDPGNPTALDALAEVYKARLLRAEAVKDDDEAVRIETLLAGHDGGRHVAWLRGDGAVTLVTDPPGAMVVVERYEVASRGAAGRWARAHPDRRSHAAAGLGPAPDHAPRLP
jgi:serine/threonine protein kinase